jgi:hypothetical protein
MAAMVIFQALVKFRLQQQIGIMGFFFSSFSSGSGHNKVWFKDKDDALASFRLMLLRKPLPCIVEFSKLFSSIVRMGHYETEVYLSKEIEFLGIEYDINGLSIMINCSCHLHCMESWVFCFEQNP